MGIFDFLNDIGESKEKFTKIEVNKDIDSKIDFLEILQSRNLIMEDFKNELIELLVNNKISEEVFYHNVNKSINIHNEIELKLISLDDDEFKLKNDKLEYIGEIDRMPNDTSILNPNRGKVSYNFAVSLFNHLKGRRIKLGEINALSDALDFKLMKIFHIEQITK